ncbi:MAG: Tad domain-containing protein, partial [Candidatus Dormibacteraeota bacterium]|nr:Tad domain-containing protein [Candidatus Dormibacteraeota bacterium]
MMLVVLFGMAGLAIDGGRAYWERRILQNSVDAAALAASDNYQDSNSISNSLHAAATQYAANERIYTVASAAPSWAATTVDITWPGSADTVHVVVSVATITRFDVTSVHRVGLAFMPVLGVSSPVTVGAHAQSQARTGGTFGSGLITLSTATCTGIGADSLGVTAGGTLTVTGANVQVNGSARVSSGTLTTDGKFSDNCT